MKQIEIQFKLFRFIIRSDNDQQTCYTNKQISYKDLFTLQYIAENRDNNRYNTNC